MNRNLSDHLCIMLGSYSCGFIHTVCLSDSGNIYSFGGNDCGQLGIGSYEETSIPQRISSLPIIHKISCGYKFTICLDETGKLWSFGSNNFGQLGIHNTITKNSPQEITGIYRTVSDILCGGFHTLCLTSKKKELWSFGYNRSGQLCLGHAKTFEKSPKRTKFFNVLRLSAGYEFSMFQCENGEIYACGFNGVGQLGVGNNTIQIQPILIPNLPGNIISFSCGAAHAIFLDDQGIVYSTGSNVNGELGNCSDAYRNILTSISNIPKVKFITCGCNYTLCLDWDGKIWCFGRNSHAQLGLGDTTTKMLPEFICSFKQPIVSMFDGFGAHSIIKDKHGDVFIFGKNNHGQLTDSADFPFQLIPKRMKDEYSSILSSETQKNSNSSENSNSEK